MHKSRWCSLDSMEGADAYSFYRPRASSSDLTGEESINTMAGLVRSLDYIFKSSSYWPTTKEMIEALLKKVSLTTDECNMYTFWDVEKAYTRNLVYTDGKHYTLLLLCWNAGRESSIHNHPCDGCFVKTIRGCVRETRYTVHEETQEVRVFACERVCIMPFPSQFTLSHARPSTGAAKSGAVLQRGAGVIHERRFGLAQDWEPQSGYGFYLATLVHAAIQVVQRVAQRGRGHAKAARRGEDGFLQRAGAPVAAVGRTARPPREIDGRYLGAFSDEGGGRARCGQGEATPGFVRVTNRR